MGPLKPSELNNLKDLGLDMFGAEYGTKKIDLIQLEMPLKNKYTYIF